MKLAISVPEIVEIFKGLQGQPKQIYGYLEKYGSRSFSIWLRIIFKCLRCVLHPRF